VSECLLTVVGGAGGASGSAAEVGHVSLDGGGGGGVGGGGGGGGSSLMPAGGSEAVESTGVPLVRISYHLVPTSKDQCKGPGWQDYPQFTNQGQCVRFVETGK
jgi:hypothetical protein